MSAVVAAVDLGASSGRVVLGEAGPGLLRVEVVARFANEPVRLPDGLHWDIVGLYRAALDGLGGAVRRAGRLAGVAVDSWAVDYGLLKDGRLLGLPYHYRDPRSANGVAAAHAAVPFEELHARNGLQFLPFTTLYQLAADPWCAEAQRLLLVPDLLGYWLTGRAVTERTNASTTGLLDIRTGEWDFPLIERLALPGGVFGPLVDPGAVVGPVLPEVADAVGQRDLLVTAVGSHDTASAVVGVPIHTDDAAYICSGTWGLVGVELEQPVLTAAARAANFTNETGVDGRVRFLTNVMGLWLLDQCVQTWNEPLEGLLAAAAQAPTSVFDVQDPVFLPPGDMPTRIRRWYEEAGRAAPPTRPALVRAIVESLAQAFANAIDQAESLSRKPIRLIHLVGGGAHNHLLCQATANRTGRPVLAGPAEATAIGNILVQARTAGALTGNLETLRHLITQTTKLLRFTPQRTV
ncbi:rhamnulokinase [Actinokineospora sp. 24-640]